MPVEETNKCEVCLQPASQRCSGCLNVYYCGKEHQREGWKKHKKLCKPFKLMKDEILGRYLVATRDIKEGEVVLSEPPIVWGPAQFTVPVCVGCGKVLTEENSRPCSKCGWPVCSIICEQAPCHIPECTYTVQRGKRVMISNFQVVHPLYQCLTVLRCLYQKQFLPEVWKKLSILESHTAKRKGTKTYERDRAAICDVILKFFRLSEGFTEEEIMDVCGILKVNGHEIPLEDAPHVAVYKTAAMIEHNCRANCWKSFSNKGEIVIVAGQDIHKGDHISICYTDPLWSTPNRRHHLQETKFFWCNCQRCQDVTEFGTYFSSVKCRNSACDGIMLPKTFIENSNNEKLSDWYCNKCGKSSSYNSVQDVLDRIGEDLTDLEKGSIEACKNFLKDCKQFLPPNQYYLTDLNVALAQMIGDEFGYDLSKVSDEDLELKENTCRHLTDLLRTLVPGEKRLLGVILYTLQSTLAEKSSRKANSEEKTRGLHEAKAVLSDALKILKYQSVISSDGKFYVRALLDLRRLEEDLKVPPVT